MHVVAGVVPPTLSMITSMVHEEFDVSGIIVQLKEAMRKGFTSKTFVRDDHITDMSKMREGHIHSMQASRLQALGWVVERKGLTFDVSGWGIPYE